MGPEDTNHGLKSSLASLFTVEIRDSTADWIFLYRTTGRCLYLKGLWGSVDRVISTKKFYRSLKIGFPSPLLDDPYAKSLCTLFADFEKDLNTAIGSIILLQVLFVY